MSSYYEAEENYYYFKNKCENAIQSKQTAKSSIMDCSSNKINFEKRIEQLEKIIEMLEEERTLSGVIFEINLANKRASNTNESFKQCVKCDGLSPAEFQTSFKTKSVMEDDNSKNALDELKQEKSRLENEIENLNKQIKNFEDVITNLTHSINNYSYEMSYNKKIMNDMF